MNFGTNAPINRVGSRTFDTVYTNDSPYLMIANITCRDTSWGFTITYKVNGNIMCEVLDNTGILNKKTINLPVPPYGTYQVTRFKNTIAIEAWTEILTADIPTGYSLQDVTGLWAVNTDYVNNTGSDQYIFLDCTRNNSTKTYLLVDGVRVSTYQKSNNSYFTMQAFIPNGSVWRIEGNGPKIRRAWLWSK